MSVSHVHLVPIVKVSRKSCWLDDTHKQLLCADNNKLLFWNLAAQEGGMQAPPQVCFLSQGPVITARFSSDKQLLAVMRSNTEIEFVNQEDGSQFWQKCKSTSKLLGYFWCDGKNCDVVFVTTGGLELYKLLESKKGLQLKETKKHDIKWYRYTADTKLIIIQDSSRLLGYQFQVDTLVKLPKFQVDAKGTLTPESIHPLALYGKLFCCHINALAERVVLYRLYKDAIIKQFSFPTYSKHMGISVVDNLLLVHHMDSGLVMIFDVMTNNMQPFVSPLPVLCRQMSSASNVRGASSPLLSSSPSTSAMNSPRDDGGSKEEGEEDDEMNPFPSGTGNCITMGHFLLDVNNEMAWRIELDLDAIASSCSNRVQLISFLHRRSEHRRIISVLKTMVQEYESLVTLRQAFEIICFVSANSEQAAAGHHSTINEVHQIFSSLFEDQAVEVDFLLSAMETFYLCSTSFQLKLPSCFFCLMVDMLIMLRRFEDLTQYLSGHFFEDSKELASKLESLSEEYPHTSEYAIDMYFRLKEYDQCCAILFKHNRLIDSLRMLKDHHLSSIAPVTFLDAAAASQDPMLFASVYRFCKEFVPGFTYNNILKQ